MDTQDKDSLCKMEFELAKINYKVKVLCKENNTSKDLIFRNQILETNRRTRK